MIESQTDESKCRPPDTYDLTREISATRTEETSQTNQPVRADTSEKDLSEVGGDLLQRGERLSFLTISSSIENTTISADDADHEERTCQVSKEAKYPMSEHEGDAKTSMEAGNCCVLSIC